MELLCSEKTIAPLFIVTPFVEAQMYGLVHSLTLLAVGAMLVRLVNVFLFVCFWI